MAATTKERLAHLNSLRELAGLKPVNTWKESKDKLEAAIAKLEEPASATAPEKKTSKAKEKREAPEANPDTFTLGDIARELGKNPKVLRAKFRRLYPSHDGAWEFANSRRKEITAAAKGSK